MHQGAIGILTSGGDCSGLNAVIRGSVKAACQLGYRAVGILKGYEGLLEPARFIELDHSNTSGILTRGGTILGSTNKGHFAAKQGVDDRMGIDPELIQQVRKTTQDLNLKGLICVGGDGSLSVAQQFHEAGVPVVGVPKTIDNDLSATAFTFGFDSAVACATDALDRLHSTAESHERVIVLEVMGRHAGWIALHSGIAGGADVILLPEIPWTFEHVCAKIQQRADAGKSFTIVVVAEGAHWPDGGIMAKSVHGQQVRLGGIGERVAHEIEQLTGKESRAVVLGHLQRGGPPTNFDRVLATQFGAHAVRFVVEGRFGQMVSYQPPDIVGVPIEEAVNVLSQVSPQSSAVVAGRAMGVCFGDTDGNVSPFKVC